MIKKDKKEFILNMIKKDKKEFMLNVIKNKGSCKATPPFSGKSCMPVCLLTGKRDCLCDKDAYKVAVDWVIKNCKEELLEILI